MIKPTIGRVVWYHRYDSSVGGETYREDIEQREQELAALVTYVWNDTMVNLVVFDVNGVGHSRTSVQLWQGEGDRPTGSAYCEWMPYQKSQVAKHEAAGKPAV